MDLKYKLMLREQDLLLADERIRILNLERDMLKTALEDIMYPMSYVNNLANESDSSVDGPMAVSMCKDAEFLKGIAREALAKIA